MTRGVQACHACRGRGYATVRVGGAPSGLEACGVCCGTGEHRPARWRGVAEEASIGMAPIYECGRQRGQYDPRHGLDDEEECADCRAWLEDLLRRAMAAGAAGA